VLGRETPVQPYRHTAIWRFVDKCRNGSAIRHRSRKVVKCSG
jgi:hypothetical protein